jgi:hypothetical protein
VIPAASIAGGSGNVLATRGRGSTSDQNLSHLWLGACHVLCNAVSRSHGSHTAIAPLQRE